MMKKKKSTKTNYKANNQHEENILWGGCCKRSEIQHVADFL